MRSLSITTRPLLTFTLPRLKNFEGRIYKVRREKFKRNLLLATIGRFRPTQLKDRGEIFFRSFLHEKKGRKKKHGRNRACSEKPRFSFQTVIAESERSRGREKRESLSVDDSLRDSPGIPFAANVPVLTLRRPFFSSRAATLTPRREIRAYPLPPFPGISLFSILLPFFPPFIPLLTFSPSSPSQPEPDAVHPPDEILLLGAFLSPRLSSSPCSRLNSHARPRPGLRSNVSPRQPPRVCGCSSTQQHRRSPFHHDDRRGAVLLIGGKLVIGGLRLFSFAVVVATHTHTQG